MDMSEIDAVRDLLNSKARPVGWEERRRRIEEVCAVWPVAGDVALEAVDVDGLKAGRARSGHRLKVSVAPKVGQAGNLSRANYA